MLRRFSMPRLQLGRAIAVDGKRIRGANRNGDGHFETATLVEHATRLPMATLSFNEEGGEIAAVRALLERSMSRGASSPSTPCIPPARPRASSSKPTVPTIS